MKIIGLFRRGRWLVAGLVAAVALIALLASPTRASAPVGRYSVIPGGSFIFIRDNKTGLFWQQGYSASLVPLATARSSSCQGLSSGQFTSGWRLPTIKELQTLIDVRTNTPAVDTSYFLTPSPSQGFYFWSTTPFVNDPTAAAWMVDFAPGLTTPSTMPSQTAWVRCLHDP